MEKKDPERLAEGPLIDQRQREKNEGSRRRTSPPRVAGKLVQALGNAREFVQVAKRHPRADIPREPRVVQGCKERQGRKGRLSE